MRVTVQVPAYREGPAMAPVLEEIVAQDDGGHDVTVEAWVTLSPPQKSRCSTWQTARSVDGVGVYEAPAGKLSARNEAHDHAVEQGADVIVSWDADAHPADPLVLDRLVGAIDGPAEPVVANSVPRATVEDGSVLGRAVDFFGSIEDTLRPHVHGQCHAMSRTMWETAGPFDTEIDQTEGRTVRSEEEFRFHQTAEQVGEVVEVEQAVVFNDPRRHHCKIRDATRIGGAGEGFCGRRGVETFSPEHEHHDAGCGCGQD